MLRRILVATVAAAGIVVIACPTAAREPTAPPPSSIGEPHNGDPCCDAKWCLGQEGACTSQCAKYKRGSEKWKECNKYCSGALSRCTACCRTHRVPHCEHYCFDG